jgi:hypothetical protein
MKRLFCIFLLIGAAIIYFGCSENNPLDPNLNQNEMSLTNLGKKIHYTFFDGTSYTISLVEGKLIFLPNGTLRIIGWIADTDDQLSDPRISGIITWKGNMDIYPDGSDKRWGSGESEDGQWDLRFNGWLDLIEGVTYEVDGHGKGEYQGLKIHMTYLKPIGDTLFTVNGYIIEHY